MTATVLITRPQPQAEEFAKELSAQGFHTIIAPVLQLFPLAFEPPEMTGYDGLIFTSAAGVRIFAEKSGHRNIPVYVPGPQTAEAARSSGYKTVHDLKSGAEEIINIINGLTKNNQNFLYIRGRHVSVDLEGRLQASGRNCDSVNVYAMRPVQALPAPARRALESGAIDVIPFFSTRTAETFIQLVRKAGLENSLDNIKALSISPAVLEYVRVLNWGEAYAAAHPNRDSLLKTLQDLKDRI